MPARRAFAFLAAASLLAATACDAGLEAADPDASVARVVITPATSSLFEDATQQLDAAAFDSNNQRIPGRVFAWSTTDASIATVSETGQVTAVAPGLATVRATTGGVNGAAEITVLPPNPSGQTIAVYPSITYQTMTGWEATTQLGQLECDHSLYLRYRDAMLDRTANELGINRLRLEIQSGAENSIDWYERFRSGQIDRATWRPHWYEVINDNSDPFTINSAGFHFTLLDDVVDDIVNPMRARLAARGEALKVNLNYVDFTQSAFEHSANPEEYAELMLATFQHLKSKYGWVPDVIEIVLEPDNTQNWRGSNIAAAIVAAGDRLKAAGFRPGFIAPSNTNATNAVSYFDEMVKNPRVLEYLTDLAYHRYGGVSVQTIQNIGARAVQYGIRTSMLEHIGSGYQDLHQDIALGRNSAWQQYTIGWCDASDPGGRYFAVDASNPLQPQVITASRTRLLRQYFLFVRYGAVRVGAGSGDPRFDPLAFRNVDGKFVVVVKAEASGSFNVEGLPAGTYGRKYATSSAWNVDLADVTIAAGQSVPATIPGAGVMTIYRR